MLAALGYIQAADFTYDFSQGVPSTWTTSAQPNGVETTDLARGTQYTTSATLTLKGVKQATKVVITCSTNVDKKNTIGVKVGSTTFGQDELLGKANDMEKAFEATATDGDLTINITRAEKSIYIKKVVVTCDEAPAGNNDDDDDDDDGWEELMTPSYDFEPEDKTSVTFTFDKSSYYVESLEDGTSATTFAFQNDKGVAEICLIGDVKTGTYNFSEEMTPGTALASLGSNLFIDYPSYVGVGFNEEGYIKDIYYLVSGSISVTKTGSNIKMEVNATSYNGSTFTLSYSGIPEEQTDDEELNFDYEPEEKTTITRTADMAQAEGGYDEEYDIPFTYVYLGGEDLYSELLFIAEPDEDTFVAPGTYTISDTFEEGTVVVSPGGDDTADYPSFVGTDVDEEGYYYTTYYLASGTVTVTAVQEGVKIEVKGTSHFGSTINVTYIGSTESAGIEEIQSDCNTTNGKIMQDGKLIIKSHGRIYNASGLIVK